MNAVVKITLVIALLFVLICAASANAVESGNYLLIKIDGDTCVLTRVMVADGYNHVYQNIYRPGSVSGPSPDRYKVGNEIGDYIVAALFTEADRIISTDISSLNYSDEQREQLCKS